ncbi:MAG: hypothetical protein LBU13_02665 [Synergistaceae bacterium]|jgi:tellurite resistance protein|nr:hypothetical protein [Synergistaceae bacterium]
MQARAKKEEIEFVGQRMKNQSIVSRIRDHGYMGVMFNNEDFLDAVVWAANVVFEYRDFFNSRKSEVIVASLNELPFFKLDVINAHFVLLHYYNMKKNFVLVEQFKQSLYSVARFQKIADADADVIKKADERLSQSIKNEDDFNFNTEPELHGAEKKYNQYASLVTAEIEKFRDECMKAKV